MKKCLWCGSILTEVKIQKQAKFCSGYYKIRHSILLLAEKKQQPCADCGVEYPRWVMQFDHVPDKGTKKFSLATLNASAKYSFEEIVAELSKCEVVCANCHAERTHSRILSSQLDAGIVRWLAAKF